MAFARIAKIKHAIAGFALSDELGVRGCERKSDRLSYLTQWVRELVLEGPAPFPSDEE
jgi:hypothetical protein